MSDDIYVKSMEDVIIGTGVILVCVTVSLVSAPAFPAVGMFFSASASTGMNFALQSGAISFAAAAITKLSLFWWEIFCFFKDNYCKRRMVPLCFAAGSDGRVRIRHSCYNEYSEVSYEVFHWRCI